MYLVILTPRVRRAKIAFKMPSMHYHALCFEVHHTGECRGLPHETHYGLTRYGQTKGIIHTCQYSITTARSLPGLYELILSSSLDFGDSSNGAN